MFVLQQGNLALRFLLEMVLLAAIGAATWRMVSHPLLGAAAAGTAVIALAAAWALVVHGVSVPAPARAATQMTALILGTLAVAHVSEARLAAAVAMTAVLNAALLSLWNQ